MNNETNFITLNDQSAALTVGGNGCRPRRCWDKKKTPFVNIANADAIADAAGDNTQTDAFASTKTVMGQSSYSKAGSYAASSNSALPA